MLRCAVLLCSKVANTCTSPLLHCKFVYGSQHAQCILLPVAEVKRHTGYEAQLSDSYVGMHYGAVHWFLYFLFGYHSCHSTANLYAACCG